MHQQFRIVGPIGDGTLRPASRINSKETSIIKISTIIGKGTLSLEARMEYRRLVGRISWWNPVIATYIPGNNKVIIPAIKRIALRKLVNIGFKFVSSGENKKSSMVAGAINAYGLPLTKIIILP